MKIYNSADSQIKPSLVMMVYGSGGVGKTTFASTAPKPLLLDCENGAKYFGLRGIKVDVVSIESGRNFYSPELMNLNKGDKYQTIIIDPVGEAMEKMKQGIIASQDTKNVQRDGSLTMAGWGFLKTTMRNYIKMLRDSGKHVLLVAHIEEKADEQRLVKRPKIETKLADEVVNMVDVVGYMTTFTEGTNEKRIIIVDPASDKYTAKDRTGQLGKIIEPDFAKIVDACQGNKKFAWSKGVEKPEAKAEEKEPAKPTKAATLKDKLETANKK